MANTTRFKGKLGRRCRQVRQEQGLSQMDLVRYHDFTLSHLQKIERGDLDPRVSTLKRLAGALGVSLSELLEGI